MEGQIALLKNNEIKNEYHKYQNNIIFEKNEKNLIYIDYFIKDKFIKYKNCKTYIKSSERILNKSIAFDNIFNYLYQFKFINSNYIKNQ